MFKNGKNTCNSKSGTVSNASFLALRKTSTPAEIEPVSRRMNPLPPIEQYSIYTNNAFRQDGKLPLKDIGQPSVPKKARDAMVANLFAEKQAI